MSDVAAVPSKPVAGHHKQANPPRICVLGAVGAGKSTFLAGLAVLGEPNRRSGLTLAGRDDTTQATLLRFAKMLRGREWPPATNKTTLLRVVLGITGTETELLLLDYPGEDFKKALGELDSDANRQFLEFFRKCDALVLLFDPQLDLQSPDPEGLIERQTAHLNAIVDLARERLTNGGSLDVAVVLTKVDRDPELTNRSASQARFLRHAPALNKRLAERTSDIAYFPLSAVGRPGSCASNDDHQPPSALEPFGYEDLFTWVLSRRQARFWQQRLIFSFAAAVILIVLSVTFFQWNKSAKETAVKNVQDPGTSIDVIADTGKNTSDPKVLDAANEKLKEHLEKLRSRLNRSVTPEETEEVIKEIDQLKPKLSTILRDEFDKLDEQARRQKRQQRLKQVQTEFAGKTARFPGAADKFLLDFPDGDEAITVKQLKVEWHLDRRANGRREIRGMVVTKPGDLFDKQRRIEEYLKEFTADESKLDVASMRRAAELSRMFYETHSYKVTLKQSGGFLDKRYHVVKVVRDKQPLHEARSAGKASEINWADQNFEFKWKAGQSIGFELWDDWTPPFSDGRVGTTEDSSPTALSLVGRKAKLTVDPNYASVVREPFVSCVVDGISADDWEAFRRFITPGDGWK